MKVLFFSCLWAEVHEILRNCRGLSVASSPFLGCLWLFRRYSPLSLEVVNKRPRVDSFGPVGEGAKFYVGL